MVPAKLHACPALAWHFPPDALFNCHMRWNCPSSVDKKWGVAHDSVGAIRCQVDVTAVKKKSAPDVRKWCCGLSASHACWPHEIPHLTHHKRDLTLIEACQVVHCQRREWTAQIGAVNETPLHFTVLCKITLNCPTDEVCMQRKPSRRRNVPLALWKVE